MVAYVQSNPVPKNKVYLAQQASCLPKQVRASKIWKEGEAGVGPGMLLPLESSGERGNCTGVAAKGGEVMLFLEAAEGFFFVVVAAIIKVISDPCQ